MSDEEFRADIREVVQRHNPDADTMRALAADFKELAGRWDDTEEVL